MLRLPDVFGQVFVDRLPDDAEEPKEAGAAKPTLLFGVGVIAVTHLQTVELLLPFYPDLM